jgi:hypothetical protein
MEYFYLYIFGLVIFIVAVSYYNTYYSNLYKVQEGFNERKIILMGDSILDNYAYVPNGKSIENLLVEKKTGPVLRLATNEALNINDVYNQVSKLPQDDKSAVIYLSIGSNNLLEKVNSSIEHSDSEIINPTFDEYKVLVSTIREKVPNAKIMIFDLYTPRNKTYEKYYSIIQDWNNKLSNYAAQNNLSMFKSSFILTEPEDFTKDAVPSSIGGQKLADAMAKIY